MGRYMGPCNINVIPTTGKISHDSNTIRPPCLGPPKIFLHFKYGYAILLAKEVTVLQGGLASRT